MGLLAALELGVKIVQGGAAFYRWVRGIEDEQAAGPSQPLPYSAVEHQRAQAAAAAHAAKPPATPEPEPSRTGAGPEAQRGSD